MCKQKKMILLIHQSLILLIMKYWRNIKTLKSYSLFKLNHLRILSIPYLLCLHLVSLLITFLLVFLNQYSSLTFSFLLSFSKINLLTDFHDLFWEKYSFVFIILFLVSHYFLLTVYSCSYCKEISLLVLFTLDLSLDFFYEYSKHMNLLSDFFWLS